MGNNLILMWVNIVVFLVFIFVICSERKNISFRYFFYEVFILMNYSFNLIIVLFFKEILSLILFLIKINF